MNMELYNIEYGIGYTRSDDAIRMDKIVARRKYFRYLHQINTVVFAIVFAIKRNKLYLSSSIISEVSQFGHVIYISAAQHKNK